MQKIMTVNGYPKHVINSKMTYVPAHYPNKWMRAYAYEFGLSESQVKYIIDTEEWKELPEWTPPK